ncbi:thioredoxin domain-containing protein [Marinicaulis aureus]|uniref:Thioredoxin domain-containing protein n=1 Tax=Hyphococcus aureus TaxID=2666033 RepID=A0ABW1KV08_9PROT
MRVKNFIFPAVLVVGLAVFALTGRDSASGADYTLDREPEVIAATFSSAWCSSCKILKPRLAEVMPDFADQPVKFVELDFTFGERGAIEEQARAEGLENIYPRFKGATGFTLLVDRKTGDIIDSLTVNYDKNAMRSAIAQAVAIAARSDVGEDNNHDTEE